MGPAISQIPVREGLPTIRPVLAILTRIKRGRGTRLLATTETQSQYFPSNVGNDN